MRYLTYDSGQGPRLGALRGDKIIDVARLMGDGPTSLLELIQAGPDRWQAVAQRFGQLQDADPTIANLALPYEEKIVLAPIPRPLKNVVCLGRNYYKHLWKAQLPGARTINPRKRRFTSPKRLRR